MICHRYNGGILSAYSPEELVQIRKDLIIENNKLQNQLKKKKIKCCSNCKFSYCLSGVLACGLNYPCANYYKWELDE